MKRNILVVVVWICCFLFFSPSTSAYEVFTNGFTADQYQNSLNTGLPIKAVEMKLPENLTKQLLRSNSFGLGDNQLFKPYIIGGENTSKNEYPEFALIAVTSGDKLFVICGGTMIAPNKVLTAAHCLQVGEDYEYVVIPNFYSFDDSLTAAAVVPVIRVATHPDFSPYGLPDHDLGILTLASDVSSPYAKLYKGPDRFVGDIGTAIGVGLTDSTTPTIPEMLQEVRVPIVSNQECNENWQDLLTGVEPATANVICAGYTTDGRGSCRGDSGGALWNEINGQRVLVGAASFGFPSCELNRATQGYARVSAMTDFIRSESPLSEFINGFNIQNISVIMQLLDDSEKFLPPADLYITASRKLIKYNQSGEILNITSIDKLGYFSDARDLIVLDDGRVAIVNEYNYLNTENLSIYDPLNDSWQHMTFDDWGLNDIVTTVGIAAKGDKVFVLDTILGVNGIVVFDINAGTAERAIVSNSYQDITLGLDGVLYALKANDDAIDIINTDSMNIVKTIKSAVIENSSNAVETVGVGVDSNGYVYLTRPDGEIIKIESNGDYVASIYLGEGIHDIDVSKSDEILVTDLDGSVYLLDTSLSNINSFSVAEDQQSISGHSFGAFAAH